MDPFDLKDFGINVKEIYRNLPPSALYEDAIRHDKDARIADNGALVAYSGAKTGRSPKDKRVVASPQSENEVWWGPVNVPLEARRFDGSTASGPRTTSTPASASTASTASPAGTRRTASRCA